MKIQKNFTFPHHSFLDQGPGLQSFLKIKVTLTVRGVILCEDLTLREVILCEKNERLMSIFQKVVCLIDWAHPKKATQS